MARVAARRGPGQKRFFCDAEHIAKTGAALLSDMAHIPAVNTPATTIKAIISTPPGGPLVFLIGVAFPIIVLLVILLARCV